jgi:hypothetical protein
VQPVHRVLRGRYIRHIADQFKRGDKQLARRLMTRSQLLARMRRKLSG